MLPLHAHLTFPKSHRSLASIPTLCYNCLSKISNDSETSFQGSLYLFCAATDAYLVLETLPCPGTPGNVLYHLSSDSFSNFSVNAYQRISGFYPQPQTFSILKILLRGPHP